LQHFGRRGGRDRDKWGIAIDHELNLALIEHKAHAKNLHPPKMILADEKYKGMTAEQIYSKLPDNCKDQPLDFHLDLSAADKERLGKNKGMKIPCLADPNSPAMISRWQQRLQEAAERAARERGHLPGNVAEIVDALKNPTIPWQRFLQDWICTQLSRDDFDWRYFNPMYIDEHNMYLPACRNETIGAIVIIVDTSGSMGSEQLSQCMTEFINIRQNYGIEELHLIQCDAQVNSHKIYSQHDFIDPKKIEISGRGGTDLTQAFDYIKANNIQPEFCCVMTDGCTPWPEKRTPFPCLAALTKHHDKAPDWMDKFVLDV
jgi:predicted metal-dependent peptidase